MLAEQAGLVADRLGDVAFVVSELATNAVEHGKGMARLLGWATDTALVFQTVNAGGLANPLAGRLPAPPHQRRGRGLLAANVLTDLLRIYTNRNRTAIRAYFHRSTPHPTG